MSLYPYWERKDNEYNVKKNINKREGKNSQKYSQKDVVWFALVG